MALPPGKAKKKYNGHLEEVLLRVQGDKPALNWVDEDPSIVTPSIEAKAAEARLCIGATRRQISSGELTFRDGANEFEFQLNEYVAIAAAKMMRTGLTLAQWTDQMVGEFGEDIRPHLNDIRSRASLLVRRELVILSELERNTRATPNAPKQRSANPPSQAASVTHKRGLTVAQRIGLFVGALIIAGMCLYPPWYEESVILGEPQSRVTRPAGYYSLLVPPRQSQSPHLVYSGGTDLYVSSLRVDSTRLVIQCFVIIVLTGTLTVLLRKK